MFSYFFCTQASSKKCFIVWWPNIFCPQTQPWYTSCCDPPWADHLWRLNGRLISFHKMWAQFNDFQWVQYNSITSRPQNWHALIYLLSLVWIPLSVWLTSPVTELKMQRSRILAAGDCEEDRLVHSTTLVAEIRAQVVETSPFSGAQNMRWLKYDLQTVVF